MKPFAWKSLVGNQRDLVATQATDLQCHTDAIDSIPQHERCGGQGGGLDRIPKYLQYRPCEVAVIPFAPWQ